MTDVIPSERRADAEDQNASRRPRATRVAAGDGPFWGEISLDYEGRYRRRAALSTDQGAAFVLDLPEARELAEGDALELEDGRKIRVRAAQEPLLEARAADAVALTRLAWHLGNRHLPVAVEADRLLLQRDHVIADMLARLGASLREVVEPFHPEGGAYGHGRTHGHSHAHSHAHTHGPAPSPPAPSPEHAPHGAAEDGARHDPNAHIPARRAPPHR